MDFRTEQHNDCRFIYLLPLARNKALVEYTGFSDKRPASGVYEEALRSYLHEHIGISEFEITEWEDGEIPMAQSEFINLYGPHVINIGTAGGASKPGSGYTFYFIQRQCENIMQQIRHKKKLVQAPARKKRFAFYDKTLLHVLNRKNIPAASIFTGLFQKNEISKVLAFLNEETSLMEELKLLRTFPNKEFSAAARDSYKRK